MNKLKKFLNRFKKEIPKEPPTVTIYRPIHADVKKPDKQDAIDHSWILEQLKTPNALFALDSYVKIKKDKENER